VAGWFDRFADRHHGVARTEIEPDVVRILATDGASATITVPFGPITPTGSHDSLVITPLVDHLLRPRRIGLLLVRLGGHSIGVSVNGKVETSRTDRRQVQGRSAAGGWSQHRFARRREGQARQALAAAATDAAEILVPQLSTLDAVFLGGDQRALHTLRADPRLTPIFTRASPRILDIPEPRRTVLEDAAQRARTIEIVVLNSFPDDNR
jgi:hypothetical protein